MDKAGILVTAFFMTIGFTAFVFWVGGRANPNGIAGPRTRWPVFLGVVIVTAVVVVIMGVTSR